LEAGRERGSGRRRKEMEEKKMKRESKIEERKVKM